MSPDRRIQTAAAKLLIVDPQELVEPLERDDHVRRGLRNARIHPLLRAADTRVDAGRHRFTQRQQLTLAPAIARHRDLHPVQHTGFVQRAAETDQRCVRGARFPRPADLVERPGGGHFRRQLQRDKQRHRRAVRDRHAVRAIGEILAQDRQTSRVHMLDRGDVEAVRILLAPRVASRLAEPGHEADRRAPIVEWHEREAHRRPCLQHPQRHRGDHAEGAFGSDEEIDQIHRRRGEIAGGAFRHIRHPIRRHRNPRRPVGQHDVEEPVAAGRRLSALDVEHLAVGQHDGQRPHPLARRSVLERGGACCVGGNDAADEGAREGRHRRIMAARPRERRVELGERHTRLDANPVGADFHYAIEA